MHHQPHAPHTPLRSRALPLALAGVAIGGARVFAWATRAPPTALMGTPAVGQPPTAQAPARVSLSRLARASRLGRSSPAPAAPAPPSMSAHVASASERYAPASQSPAGAAAWLLAALGAVPALMALRLRRPMGPGPPLLEIRVPAAVGLAAATGTKAGPPPPDPPSSGWRGSDRWIFRTLRPDEEQAAELRPAKRLWDGKSVLQEVREQVNYGSTDGYVSALLSFTSELEVALAFGGVLSRIAAVKEHTVPRNKIIFLDKKYLREHHLETDAIAHARSQRSDEVLVAAPVADFQLLPVRVAACERVCAPPFAAEDAARFPSAADVRAAFNGPRRDLRVERVGGANKRMFRATIAGKRWVVHPPRPNVSLKDVPLLSGQALADLGRHEFAAFSAYRVLCPGHVVKAALYTTRLQLDWEEAPKAFQWAFLLLEDFDFPGGPTPGVERAARAAMQALIGADVLLGNWDALPRSEHDSAVGPLCSPAEMVYARRRGDGAVVRVAADRALGGLLCEDVRKKKVGPDMYFAPHNALDLKQRLANHVCYKSSVTDAHIRMAQGIMALQLHSQAHVERLRACVELSPWLQLDQHAAMGRTGDAPLWSIVQERIRTLLDALTVRVCEPAAGAEAPCARDGHVAVAHAHFIYIFGGNSQAGALKDAWRWDTRTNRCARLPDLPSPRYSHSGHIHAGQWLISYGGCPGTACSAPFLGELLVLDLGENPELLPGDGAQWRDVAKKGCQQDDAEPTQPPGRCRHASILVPNDEAAGACRLLVVAGAGPGSRKLTDVWQGTLDLLGGSGGVPAQCTVQWEKYRNLSRPCHRHFAFPLMHGAFAVLQGFGQSLMKIRVVRPFNDAGQIDERDSDIIVTHGALDFSTYRELAESKSLAGFAAVVDDISGSVFLFGGGNARCGPQGNGRRGGRGRGRGGGGSFGVSVGGTARPSRVFRLHCGSNRGASAPRGQPGCDAEAEWTWSPLDDHEKLDEEYRLPLWTSWSGCLVGDHVYLFGGRNDDRFSDRMYMVRVRHTGTAEAVARLKYHGNRLEREIQAFGDPDVAIAAVQPELPSLSLPASAAATATAGPAAAERQADAPWAATSLRLLCANVHGWSTQDRGGLNDGWVYDLVEQCNPDVVCLQEVKQPMPADPPDGDCVVRLGEDVLFRYSAHERPEAVKQRLDALLSRAPPSVAASVWTEIQNGPCRYLRRVCDEGPAPRDVTQETCLERLQRLPVWGPDPAVCRFAPALDPTFGNAIIACSRRVSRADDVGTDAGGIELALLGRERRSGCVVPVAAPWGSLLVVCTHLDAHCEAHRLEQLQRLVAGLGTRPHVLCGDFNALSHWTPEDARTRERRRLEEPQRTVYRYLTEEEGYVDLEHRVPPRATSTHGLRVDYVFASRSLAPRLDLGRSRLQVLPSEPWSDHSALLALLHFHSRKRIIGLVGGICSGRLTAAKAVQRGLADERCRVEIVSGEGPDSAGDVYRRLRGCEVVLWVGPRLESDGHALASLDRVFVLCTQVMERKRRWRAKYKGSPAEARSWEKHEQRWKQRYAALKVLEARTPGKVDLVSESDGECVKRITSYLAKAMRE